MKKWMLFLFSLCMVTGLTACSSRADEINTSTESSQAEMTESETTQDTPETSTNEANTEQNHILIAYFSWADNTVVQDKEAAVRSALSHYESIGDRDNYSDVDAVASASVVAPGNTAKMAQWIQEYVGGDLFPIVVTEPYPDNYDDCMDRAANEKAENARPELKNHVADVSQYDTIFLGFPNWWSTAPMAVMSFIDENDLSGKTVIPFCAHGTGGIARSVKDVTDLLPDSTKVLEPIGVYRADINSARSVVSDWLNELGFQKTMVRTETKSNERKLKLTVADQEVVITLYDTPAANVLYEMLPLDLSFEDFNGIEKISYLQEALPTDGEPDGCDPEVGDFCLYEPWGNLSVFYQDFRYSDSLIKLGHIDSEIELLSEQQSDFSATLEALE